MKAPSITAVLLIVPTMWLAAQSCPSLTQSPLSDICSASPSENYWYYYLGDETDTYSWSVTGGTIVYGGGVHDWFLNVVWNQGSPFKQVVVEKWTTWGAYCWGVLSSNCNSEALSFNGSNSRVNIPDPSGALNIGTGPFVFEAFVKLTASHARSTVLSKRTIANGNDSDGFIVGFFGGSPYVQLGGTVNIQPAVGSINLFDGNCHHLAVRRDGSTISFFVDGIFRSYGDFTSSENISSPGPLWIGWDNAYTSPFPGWIGEVRVWNTALTDAQIQSNLGLNLSPQTGLIAYYDMKNPAGSQNLTDLSGNGRHGTLGTSASVDAADPVWLSPTQASCRVSGNFREHTIQIGRPIEVDSVKDGALNAGPKVFPSPAHNFVTVELQETSDSPVPIIIYNPMGTETLKVSLAAGEKKKVIDVRDLANGIYVLRIAGAKTLFEKRIIVLKE